MKKRALISVYDKEGIIPFAQQLLAMNWEIISTGGTYALLKEIGLEVTEVNDVTHFPEILDGRVKTLHPMIHGGLLAKRHDEHHQKTCVDLDIAMIDMVVCNLYPFEKTLRDRAKTDQDIIENIDIGGPSMIRSAAKNFKDVLVVCDVNDYDAVLHAVQNENEGFNKQLARKAFSLTASYDALIAQYFLDETETEFPELLTQTYRKVSDLRYGENPHQAASYYEAISTVEPLIFKQCHGKELSYNNINDMTGALRVLQEFEDPTAVAVKHANPCGIASGRTLAEAFLKAKESDPESIFGGIIALNRPVDVDTATLLSEIFLEVVVAPVFDEDAFRILSKKKNIRLIELPEINNYKESGYLIKEVLNGVLLQQRDTELLSPIGVKVVSERQPTQAEYDQLMFAWKSCKHLSSNAIVIANDNKVLGMGHGEVQRFWACEKAIERSREDVRGSVMASDGFFFEDTIELCHKHGIRAIIQPGGSVKDQHVIDLANKYDMTLLFTGMRHFKH